MADVKLSATLEANVNQFIGNFNKATGAVQSFEGAAIGSVNAVKRSFTILNNTKFTFGANFQTASNALANQASKTASVLGGSMVKGTNQAAFALNNLGRVAQDAPFGFIGIQNNLNPLLESFQQLKASTGSTSGALKLMASSLAGPAGIGIALSVVSSAILFYQQYQQKAKKATDETTKSVEDQRKEFIKTPYQQAYTDLESLTRNVTLAKQGFLDKKEVLKQYNEGIGQTIGKVTSLDEAEQKLVKNGDAYLKLMFLKANAEFAFKKAAEESYNLSLKQAEIDAKAPKISDKFRIDADRSKQDVEQGLTKPLREYLDVTNQTSKGLDGINTRIEVISKNLGEQLADSAALKGLEKASGKAVDIAKTAQQQVVDYAKQNGFNLNAIFDTTPDNDPLKNIRKNLIEGRVGLEDVLGRVNVTLGDFMLDYKKTASELETTPFLPVETFKIQSEKILTDLEKFAIDLNSLADMAIEGSLMGLGTAIGEAMANGGNAFEDGGRALLGSFGKFLSEYGGLLIKYGAAAVLKGKLDIAALVPGAGIPAGIAAIAAGVALVAAGAAVSAFAGGRNSKSEGSSSGNARKIPGFASGIEAGRFPGGIALVGEKGPEIINMPTGSGIIPNHQIGSVMGGGQVNLVGDLKISMRELYLSLRREEALQFRTG